MLAIGTGDLLAQDESAPPATLLPLFAADEPLDLTLTMDFPEVLKDRSEDRPYQPAILTFTDAAAGERTLEVGVKTRGNYRLHRLGCNVPPLRINFKKKQVEGTVFDGQDKLKLVTHCRNNTEAYQQYLFQEYLIYRAYNLLTEYSFRVRLARITYVDNRGVEEPIVKYAFFIEDEDDMASRNNAKAIESESRFHPEATDRSVITLLSVFQYMIGNTDWGVSAWHNIKLIFIDPHGPLVVVPYDFDWAGLIDAPYAVPDPKLDLHSVRERRFMGFCRSEEEFTAAFEPFLAQQDTLLALFGEFTLLEKRYADDSRKYLEDFYATIQHRRGLQREFFSTCQKS